MGKKVYVARTDPGETKYPLTSNKTLVVSEAKTLISPLAPPVTIAAFAFVRPSGEFKVEMPG